MLRLNKEALGNRAEWEKAGILLPDFDLDRMIERTRAAPEWVHLGAGNIFRVFPAALQQELLDQGLSETGIVVAEGYDGEIIDAVFQPYDNLTLAVTLKAQGSIEKRVIASVASSLRLDRKDDLEELRRIFRSPSLKMVSLTITEKGYVLRGRDGKLYPDVERDMKGGPGGAESYMGRLASLCYERYRAGKLPLALVSMDNCSHNGEKLFAAVDAFTLAWVKAGLADRGFADYIHDSNCVSFPWSMIDKITPRPDEGVRAMLEAQGFEDTAGKVTAKNTYVAPFVNAEETQYLVIEDAFPAGRPPLEKAGVLFSTRETVEKVERMKVCTCLNPLHTALAVFGCLLGYTKISDEMKDEDLVKLIRRIGYVEGLPVVTDPGILSPRDFIDQVVEKRLPNPFMPDTPQRIATDTSQKIPIRFGETLKAYGESETLSVKDLQGIPLVLAAWLRYLLGVDDEGKAFTVSPDPLYGALSGMLSGITLGYIGPVHDRIKHVLSDREIFGVDLYEIGLADRVEALFIDLIRERGAVRRSLRGLSAS